MKNNKKKTSVNAREALQVATNEVISSPNLSIDDILLIADGHFKNLQK